MRLGDAEQNRRLSEENQRLRGDMLASQEASILELLDRERQRCQKQEELIRNQKRELEILRLKAGTKL